MEASRGRDPPPPPLLRDSSNGDADGGDRVTLAPRVATGEPVGELVGSSGTSTTPSFIVIVTVDPAASAALMAAPSASDSMTMGMVTSLHSSDPASGTNSTSESGNRTTALAPAS